MSDATTDATYALLESITVLARNGMTGHGTCSFQWSVAPNGDVVVWDVKVYRSEMETDAP